MDRAYRNVLLEAGCTAEEIQKRTAEAFETIFYGPDCFYHEFGDDMGYMEDTGNHDARTEGMSYGMMMCVQLDKKEEFDRLWKFSKTFMYMESGYHKGYFAWSVTPEGLPNAQGPAPDGEEYFAMALLFASHRWGDGEGIFNYSAQAREILHTMIHKEEEGGRNMFDPVNHLIRFIPEKDYSDPSYHLPHFYELFGAWAAEEDRAFYKAAAEASREYLKKACHPVTGLSPEYGTFDGKPYTGEWDVFGRHDWYFSDAYRTVMNIALEHEWFGRESGRAWESEIAAKVQKFFCETVKEQPRAVYSIEGEILEDTALHPVAITASNAAASLAIDGELEGNALACVKLFLDTPLRTGDRRYYDNCLYFFALLMLSGQYRIY